ncbi:TPA: LytTR family transcriptional regulator DNA-binding domain-containing protein [Pseudomonas aeruginosa]
MSPTCGRSSCLSTSTRQSYGRRQHENRTQSHLRQALQGNLRLADHPLVLNETLKALETEFADEFIRAHRKALVRRSLISMFKTRPDDSQAGEVLLLGTENWIPVSRSHSAQIKSAMSA